MASLIGKFGALLTLDSSRFVKGMNRAGQATQAFAATASRVASNVLGFGSAIAGAAGITGMGAMVISSFKTVDALAKTSEKLGLTTESLLVLRHAAEQTGVATTQLDTAIQRMVRRVAEAAIGTGEAKGALKELGVSAQELSRLAPDVQFAMIADKMNLVANQGDRVRLAMKLFDTEGVALVNTMKLGSAGMAKYSELIKRFGGAVSAEGTLNITTFNDTMGNLAMVVKLVAGRIAANLAPVLTILTNKLLDAVQRTTAFITENWSLIKSVTAAVVKIGILIVSYYALKASILLVAAAYKKMTFAAIAAKAAQAFDKALFAALAVSPAGWLGLAAAVAAATVGYHLFNSSAMKAEANIRRAINETESLALYNAALARKQDAARKASEAHTEAIVKQAEATQKAADAEENRLRTMAQSIVSSTLTPLEKHSQAMAELNLVYRRGHIGLVTYTRRFMDLKKELAEASVSDEMEKMKDRVAAIVEETRTPIEKLRSKFAELKDLFARNKISKETLIRGLIMQAKSLGVLPDQKKELTGSFEQVVRGRFALGGGKSGRNADSEAPKQTELLAKIHDALNRGVVGVAG